MKMRQLAGTVFAALALAACGDGGEPTGGGGGGTSAVASIAVSSGDGQRIAVGRTALAPLVVVVRNAQGNGVPGVTVTWSVTAGGGSTSRTTTTTDANGESAVSFTAGPGAGDNTVSAAVEGIPSASFTIKGVTPAAVAIVAGDGQSARVSQPLARALEVRVTASDNGPVPGLAVAWAVAAGGGSLSAMSTSTDVDGRSSVVLTLGGPPGANTVTATASGLAAVTFSASGSLPVSVQVDMLNIAFVAPGGGDDVTIMLGDTVRWVNMDGVQHTATSNSTPAGGAAFDSGLLSQGQSFTFVANARGEWIYFCEVHPAVMLDARITVQ